jgi:hypothetical protein
VVPWPRSWGQFQIEKLMETLTAGYRARYEAEETRRQQIK